MPTLLCVRRVLAMFTLLGVMAAPAFALELGDAKEAGLVGETHTGYLAAVSDSSEVSALVNSINAQRKAHYQQIARKNGISLDAVEARAGKKAIENSAGGAFIDIGNGWQRK